MRHLSRRGAVLIGVGVVAIALVGFALRPSPIDVDAGAVSRGPMRVTVDDDGRTRVRDRFVITAPVSGWLQRMSIREGAAVAKGDVVAWIQPMPLDSAARRQTEARVQAADALAHEASLRVAQARTALDLAERALRRSDALFAAGAISPAAHEAAVADRQTRADDLTAAQSRRAAAVADAESARAALVTAQPAKSAVPVRSPASGRVFRITDPSARVVAASAPLLELGDAKALEVVVDVLSSDAVRIRPLDTVEIVEWGGDHPLAGRVRHIEPSAFTRVSALGVEEQRVNVLVDLLDAPPSLGDGFRVEVRTTVWSAPDVLVAPASALFQRGGDWSVFVLSEGRARQRAVSVGHRTGTAAEVLRGLSAGDSVILFPSDKIADGVRVRAVGG